MIDNEWGMSRYPLVPGHEVVGRVGHVGAAVKHLAVGQTVGLGWNSRFCNDCVSCRAGDPNFCPAGQGTIVGHHGGFADQVRAAANSVVPIPAGVDLESAGPLFCGGVTVFNPLVQFGVKPTDQVAVIGIGGLGHMALMFLHAWGCETTAFTSSEAKRKEALDLGADHALNSRDATGNPGGGRPLRFHPFHGEREAGLEPLSGHLEAPGAPAFRRRHAGPSGHRRVFPDDGAAFGVRLAGRPHVLGGDAGLQEVGPGLPRRQRTCHQGEALVARGPVPQPAVLLVERYRDAVRGGPGGAAGGLSPPLRPLLVA